VRDRSAGTPSPQPSPRWGEGALLRRVALQRPGLPPPLAVPSMVTSIGYRFALPCGPPVAKRTADRNHDGRYPQLSPRRRRRARTGAGRHRGPCPRIYGRPLSGRPQPGAARGGRDPRRPGPGARRRRHRQDPCADHPHRPYPLSRPRPALRHPRRHLHQQGGARNAHPHRHHGGPGGRRHAVARHLPLHRRQDPAPPCRDGRPQERLHHPGHRRPDPSPEAVDRGRGHRREALAGTRLRRHHGRLEEPRADPRQGAARRRRRLGGRTRHCDVRGLSGAPEGLERRRLRRPPARDHPAVPRAAGRARRLPAPLQVRPGRRVPGHERGAVSVAAAVVADHVFFHLSPRAGRGG